jgi:hypothetical protein
LIHNNLIFQTVENESQAEGILDGNGIFRALSLRERVGVRGFGCGSAGLVPSWTRTIKMQNKVADYLTFTTFLR